jgi:hypothetical protein
LTETLPEIPELTNAELVQLRIRVIALENLVIALLAEGVRPPTRYRSRNGGLHYAKTGLHAPSTDDPGGRAHGRRYQSGRSLSLGAIMSCRSGSHRHSGVRRSGLLLSPGASRIHLCDRGRIASMMMLLPPHDDVVFRHRFGCFQGVEPRSDGKVVVDRWKGRDLPHVRSGIWLKAAIWLLGRTAANQRGCHASPTAT